MTDYKPQQLDKKWQQQRAAARAFEVAEDPTRPKYYCLEMFAYPSGHAHVGHVRNYIIGDVMARTKRLRGFNVFHPFGWDAFGLPAENAAIKTGTPPETSTLGNIAHMKGRLLGVSCSSAAWRTGSTRPSTGVRAVRRCSPMSRWSRARSTEPARRSGGPIREIPLTVLPATGPSSFLSSRHTSDHRAARHIAGS